MYLYLSPSHSSILSVSVSVSFIDSRLPSRRLSDYPKFIWTISEKNPNFYSELLPSQIANHFEGINILTKKNRFCDLLRDMHWVHCDSHEIAPRSVSVSPSLSLSVSLSLFFCLSPSLSLRCLIAE
jgi:hypothetical protein